MNQPPDQEKLSADTGATGDEPIAAPSPEAPADSPTGPPAVAARVPRPSLLFLGIVAFVSLALDLGTKWWALHSLEKTLPRGSTVSAPIEVTSWLTFLLARNRGGAWGLLQTANESVRRPFFLLISVAAIVFIVYLFRKIHPSQHALRWGLPLVLGGAVGNLVDRVRYGWVIDFIDYRAGWVRVLNEQIAKLSSTHAVTDHWPTFNVADIAICVGVGLMAIDMFTSRAVARSTPPAPAAAPMAGGEAPVEQPIAADAEPQAASDVQSPPRGGTT